MALSYDFFDQPPKPKELYWELLTGILAKAQISVTIENLEVRDSAAIVENECYRALKKIVEIVRNENIDDPECFWRIEEIVCVLEKELKIHCGPRHDFG